MELWKDIEGYEGYYQVSNQGRIKSLDRSTRHSNGFTKIMKGKILKTAINRYGYEVTSISLNAKLKSFQIHRLVAKAFITNPKNKRTVNHKNGIKTDNRAVNLEWATHSENEKHAHKIGLKSVKGDKSPCRKISSKEAFLIKYGHLDMSYKEISTKYNVSRSTVSDIRRGKSWDDV